ncbi:MAG TPA: ECF transporter S component [Oscillospiraceae bacterium]|nr:ECF transporter S component [Oscillospiraceae bacterium]
MIRTNTQKLTVAGMLMAAGLLLPFAFAHGLGVQGTVLLPMHIPVLLAGFLCGPLYGAFCGLLTPALNTLLTGMPAAFPMLPIMTAELTTYGLVSGLLFWKTPLGRKKFGVLPTLATAMLCGRISYWAMFEALAAAFGELKALPVLAAVTTGLPGIVIQFLLIPAVVEALRRFRPGEDTLRSAVNLIREGTATCVVIRENRIVRTGTGMGIGPVIQLYEEGALEDVSVVDKIVGKAAAMVFVLGGAKSCYGVTMSKSAEAYLTAHHISTASDTLVEIITDRTGGGICPMEQAVMEIDDPAEGLAALKKRLEELRSENKG